MKTRYLFCLLAFSSFGFAQVGIGTTNPETALHVAGESATVRVESLNQVNNVLNDGIKLAPTFVKKNGDITLTSSQTGANSINIIDASSTFSSKVVASNILASNTTTNIYSYQITIPAESFIEVKYSLSFKIFASYNIDNQMGTRIFDGKARQIKTFFTVTGIVNEFGQISQNYYNISPNGGSGTFYNNGFAYLTLLPGTYTINFYANIAGHVGNTTQVLFGGAESLLRIRFYQ